MRGWTRGSATSEGVTPPMAIATAPTSTFTEPTTVQLGRGQALWVVIRRKPLGMASAALLTRLLQELLGVARPAVGKNRLGECDAVRGVLAVKSRRRAEMIDCLIDVSFLQQLLACRKLPGGV